MGSFNATCFASFQSIASGDRCFVLPVIQESSFEPLTLLHRGVEEQHWGVSMTRSYAHALWKPYGGFVEALYRDYGNVEPVDTPMNRIRLRELFRRLFRTAASTKEVGDNGIALTDFKTFVQGSAPTLLAELDSATERGVPATGAELFAEMLSCWTYLAKAMWEQRLFADDLFHRLRPVQWAVMHESAFDKLVELVESNLLLSGGSARREDVLQRFLDQAPGFLERQPLPADCTAGERESRLELMVARFAQESSLTDALSVLDRCGSLHYPSERVELVLAFDRYRDGGLSREELNELLKPTFDTRYALGGLNELNLRITPTAFGGEDYTNEVGRQFAQFVQTVSSEVSARREARYA